MYIYFNYVYGLLVGILSCYCVRVVCVVALQNLPDGIVLHSKLGCIKVAIRGGYNCQLSSSLKTIHSTKV